MVQKDTCTPMFTAALFTIAKTWKQSRCPSTEEWIKKMGGFPGGSPIKSLPANPGDTGYLIRKDLPCPRATKPMHNY